MLLRQKRDEVPKGTLSCPDRIMEVFYQLRHYEGSHLLLSVCGRKLIQQTLIGLRSKKTLILFPVGNKTAIFVQNISYRYAVDYKKTLCR